MLFLEKKHTGQKYDTLDWGNCFCFRLPRIKVVKPYPKGREPPIQGLTPHTRVPSSSASTVQIEGPLIFLVSEMVELRSKSVIFAST